MATFEVKVYRLEIEDHPNADVIELAKVGDYRSIVRKGQFKTGDLGVYIPEAAIVPDWLIAELGLEGKLAGKAKNRVKAIKLRGILSQGLIVPLIEYPFHAHIDEFVDYDAKGTAPGVRRPEGIGANTIMFAPEGTDVTEFLGITKWEPPIPVHMAGEVFNAFGYTLKYDIENLKKFPNVLQYGEEIVVTEKLHGTWCCFGYHPEVDTHIITSKGLSEKGLAFKLNEANQNNLYIRALDGTAPHPNGTGGTVLDRMHEIVGYDEPFYILGEIFGAGVQDLTYGGEKPQFRIFDIYVGNPGEGAYLNAYELGVTATKIGIATVPVLYVGAYSDGVVAHYTDGKETASGKEAHMREGVVIKPVEERRAVELGRVILKSISEKYLLRKNATEFN